MLNILWIISCGQHVSLIYPVENISCGERRPQVFSTGYQDNYILWVYPVERLSFTDALRMFNKFSHRRKELGLMYE